VLLRAGPVAVWMSSQGPAAEAVDWAVKRGPKVGHRPDVQPALAGCYPGLEDWQALFSAWAIRLQSESPPAPASGDNPPHALS
jgi:hypothetical protein